MDNSTFYMIIYLGIGVFWLFGMVLFIAINVWLYHWWKEMTKVWRHNSKVWWHEHVQGTSSSDSDPGYELSGGEDHHRQLAAWSDGITIEGQIEKNQRRGDRLTTGRSNHGSRR